MLDAKRLYANLNLAWHLLLHVAKKIARRKEEPGFEQFRRNYAEDNIFELSAADRIQFPEFERCVTCGLCQFQCVTFKDQRHLFPGPQNVASCFSRSLPDVWTNSDLIYYCTLCGACEVVCPDDVALVPLLNFVRRTVYRHNPHAIPDALKSVQRNVLETGNVHGLREQPVTSWQKERAQYVLFRGCAGRKDNENTARIARLLQALKVDFTTIDEVCCGSPLSMIGNDSIDEMREHIVRAIRQKGADTVITCCPHCYRTFKDERGYSRHFQTKHIVEVLAPLDLDIRSKDKVALHDSCYLGRRSGIYDQPRDIINRITDIVELDGSREQATCCGFWGGVGWICEEMARDIGQRTLRDVRESDADVLLTECPWCLLSFTNGAAETDLRITTLSRYVADLYLAGDM